MLNELYRLAGVLGNSGIVPHDWHKDFQTLPKVSRQTPCFKVTVALDDERPLIYSITSMIQEHILGLRKYMPSLGLSFPCLNIGPVIAEGKADFETVYCWNAGVAVENGVNGEKLQKLFEQALHRRPLTSACVIQERERCNTVFRDKKNETLRQCINVVGPRLKNKIGDVPDDFILLDRLIEKMEAITAEDFMRAIAQWVCQCLVDDPAAWGSLNPLMVLPKALGNVDEYVAGVPIVLEAYTAEPLTDTYRPVADEKTHKWINQQLIASDRNIEGEKRAYVADAFNEDATGHEDKVDSVTIPMLGNIKLRAMTSESPCQYRYRTVESLSFRVGKESRRKAKGALWWLREPENKGSTWGIIDGKELLFAYPAQLPKMPVQLTSLLGASAEAVDIRSFSVLAKQVIDCLSGITPDLNQVELEVFALRKMDKARTKVVFHRNLSAQKLKERADSWQHGCENIPNIRFKEWGEKKGDFVWDAPATPKPLDFSRSINRVWKMDGSSVAEVQTLEKTVGIDLLIRDQPSGMLAHFLRQAISNTQGLLCIFGQATHCGEVLSLKKLSPEKKLVPSLFGLLLHQQGIYKEHYMKSPPFLIGNALAIADQLHHLYCQHVRNGSVPPQLLGNTLMQSALETPVQALAMLARRLPPYLAWAQTNNTKDAGLSRVFLKQYRELSQQLAAEELPKRLNDNERAVLLLGYLAGVQKEDSQGETK